MRENATALLDHCKLHCEDGCTMSSATTKAKSHGLMVAPPGVALLASGRNEVSAEKKPVRILLKIICM